jgi:GDP-L-fucose synthase
MDRQARIYIAGHRGLVGSALMRNLEAKGYTSLLTRTHAELDLTSQQAVDGFFQQEKPGYVFLAAAKVGGIHANNEYPAEFIRDNLAIQTNIIHAAWKNKVRRLLFLGSSCIYPKLAPQPMQEPHLLTGPLEPTNRPYALAKIAGIEMCWSYNRQYKTQYLAVMPTNLYGPGDNYHPENSHVIPALLRRFHEAKLTNASEVAIWGTGTPRREFLYVDDMAAASVFVMNLAPDAYRAQVQPQLSHINVGYGSDVTISELAQTVGRVVGYEGRITFDTSKPDGAPRKLMDSGRLNAMGWTARVGLEQGLALAYQDMLSKLKGA